MKFSIMQCVVIQSDTLNLGLPVGETAYVTINDYRINTAYTYCVRVPSKKQNYWMPECDLVSHEDYIASATDRVIQESLINHALETGNIELFKSVRQKQTQG